MTDHLEANKDEDTSWAFQIASYAETCDSQSEEMLQHLEGLFDAFNDFIIPTEVSVNYCHYNNDLDISDCLSQAKSAEIQSQTFKSKNGVEATDIQQNIRDSQSNPMYINSFSIDRNKVKIELDSETHYLDCESPQYRIPEEFSSFVDNPIWEPVKPRKFIFSDWDAGIENGYPFSYFFSVSIHSDIWYEESDLAKRNQQNLRKFLERVETNLPVIDVDRWPDLHSVEQLRKIY